MSPRIGEIIRERRLAAGMSLGQLASKVHLTAAAVRSWERGESYPDEAIHGVLTEVLDLDPGALAVSDSVEVTSVAVPPDTAADADVSAAADAPVAVQMDTNAPVEAPEHDDAEANLVSGDAAETAGSQEEIAAVEAEAADDDAPPPQDIAPRVEPVAAEYVAGGPDLDAVRHDLDAMFPSNGTGPLKPVPAAVGAPAMNPALLDAPTMQVPAAQLAPTAMDAPRSRPQEAVRPVMTVAPVSYIENPAERWRYWLRTALLAVVMVVLLVVALWALGELRDAVADVWNGINIGETPEVDLG